MSYVTIDDLLNGGAAILKLHGLIVKQTGSSEVAQMSVCRGWKVQCYRDGGKMNLKTD